MVIAQSMFASVPTSRWHLRYTAILKVHSHLGQAARQQLRKALKLGEAGDAAAQRTFDALADLGVAAPGHGYGPAFAHGLGAGGSMRRAVTTSVTHAAPSKQVGCWY